MDQIQSCKENESVGKDPMQLLEDALIVCKFGKFHLQLMLVTLATSSALILLNSTTAFMIPVSECDLEMDNMMKGFLISMQYAGLITLTAFISFLTDAFGRKKFLIVGSFGTCICRIIQGMSQNFATMVVGKFLEGVFVCFCFPVAVVLLAEVVHKDIRERVLLINSAILSLPLIVIALLSWAILPQKWDFTLIEGYFEIHSWNIYFFVCSLIGLLSGIAYCFFPESPKYYLTHGKEEKALEVLKYIYSVNTGKAKDSFPVTSFKLNRNSVPASKISIKKQIVDGLFETKLIFRKPLLGRLINLSLLTFSTLYVNNTTRSWYPQISTIIENYEERNNKTAYYCDVITNYTNLLLEKEILDSTFNVTTNFFVNETVGCISQASGADTYISGVILGVVSSSSIVISTTIVHLVGLNLLIFFQAVLCSSCLFALYWTSSARAAALLFAAACGLSQTSMSMQMNLMVQLFPTTSRSSATAIVMMMGRISSLTGSVLFPVMLNYGCMVPVLVMAILMLGTGIQIFFIPNPKNASESMTTVK